MLTKATGGGQAPDVASRNKARKVIRCALTTLRISGPPDARR